MKAQRAMIFTLSITLLVSLLSLTASARPADGNAARGEAGGKAPAEKDKAGAKLVKQVYDRLARYNQAANRFSERARGATRQPGFDLSFDLNNVRTGPAEEILDRPIGQLVSRPAGRVVEIDPQVRQVGNGPEHAAYEAKWGMRMFHPNPREDWDNTTLREVLAISKAQPVTHYVAYDVTASLAGQERRYRALALFGDLYKSSATPQVVFFDNIVSPTVLHKVAQDYRPFVRANWNEYINGPEYRAYRDALAAAKGDYKQANRAVRAASGRSASGQPDAGATDAAAQQPGGYEGLPPDEPIDPCWDDPCCGDPYCGGGGGPTNEYTYGTPVVRELAGDEGHCTGRHYAKTQQQGMCTYTYQVNNNHTTCRVEIPVRHIEDTGWRHICHATGKETKFNDGQGPMNTGVSCNSTFAAAVKGCLFCQCQVSVEIHGVGAASTDGFWKFESGLSYTCAAR